LSPAKGGELQITKKKKVKTVVTPGGQKKGEPKKRGKKAATGPPLHYGQIQGGGEDEGNSNFGRKNEKKNCMEKGTDDKEKKHPKKKKDHAFSIKQNSRIAS